MGLMTTDDPCSFFVRLIPGGAVEYSYHDADGTGHYNNPLTTVSGLGFHDLAIVRSGSTFTVEVDGTQVGAPIPVCGSADWGGEVTLGAVANSELAAPTDARFDNLRWTSP